MSAGASVEALTLSLGAFHLKKLDFALSHGEILVILGPNGAGKSVTLETIAGFHRPESGRVLIGGRDVTGVPPERRNVGFVVQNFGLFPHLSVAQNVAIARRSDRAVRLQAPKFPAQGDPAALLAYLGIPHLEQRMPAELSPGEKQRVALARALAGAPDLFLFDEPFAALDTQTREQLRDELKSFLRALSIPAIFVTHDHSDAMTLADRIVVLHDGGIVQNRSAVEVLQRPANAFVARFIGVENVLSGRVTDASHSLLTVAIGERTLRAVSSTTASRPDGSVMLSIRAEDVVIDPGYHASPSAGDINRLPGRVVELRRAGPLVSVVIDCGFPLKAYLLGPQVQKMGLERGSPVVAEVAPDAIHVMTG